VKVAYLITVRLKSTRLPQKALRLVAGRPILAHQIDRVKQVSRADEIVVCTSTHPQDDPLEALARDEGVSCFRGDADDVLVRLQEAATRADADYVLNITGDCPFVDPQYADRVVNAFERTNADLIRAFDLPHGAFSYGIKPAALAKAIEIKDDTETSAWGRYFTDTDLFDLIDLDVDPRHRRPELRMTLDYPEDLAFVEAVFAALHRPDSTFSLDDIIEFLDAHPEVVALNEQCGAWYRDRFAAESSIRLKPRYPVNRIAIVGCGSIGQRHARNLRRLGVEEVIACRSGRGVTRELDTELDVREVESLDALVKAKPDAAIISNPTSLHVKAALSLIPHVKGLFIEKPIAESLPAAQCLLKAVAQARVVSFVGYNLQFHPAIEQLMSLRRELGRALVFQCQVGQWLPDWHPTEDYRQAYFARRDLGGGMIRTLSHELHLAIELLGPARHVHATVTPYDSLSADVDLIADLQVQHASGSVSQVHLDAVQRTAHRTGVLSAEQGWLRYDLVQPSLIKQSTVDRQPVTAWNGAGFDSNDPYLAEMSAFLQYVREGRVRHAHDVWRGMTTMALIQGALKSAASGQTAAVSAEAAR